MPRRKEYAWPSRKSVAAVEKARPDHKDGKGKRRKEASAMGEERGDEARIPATTTDGRVRN